jgi:hypothetical protein
MTDLFDKLINKYQPHLLNFPSPETERDVDTGSEWLAYDQEEFYSRLEDWINQNERFLAAYLKAKAKEDLDKAQTKMAFMKDL